MASICMAMIRAAAAPMSPVGCMIEYSFSPTLSYKPTPSKPMTDTSPGIAMLSSPSDCRAMRVRLAVVAKMAVGFISRRVSMTLAWKAASSFMSWKSVRVPSRGMLRSFSASQKPSWRRRAV